MVFSPRDAEEMEAVYLIAKSSFDYAAGVLKE
jgi:hypothetical protein